MQKKNLAAALFATIPLHFYIYPKLQNKATYHKGHRYIKTSSGINSFDDIKGKIVNIGAPGTGVRGTIEDIMRAKNWKIEDFKLATSLSKNV